MSDIFISYAREDLDRVIPIVKAIEEQGWSTFWDWRSIPVGKTWRQFIQEGIDRARCVLVLWSEKSIDSEWVIEEADHGKSNKMLVPARIDDVRPPMGFGQIQAANLINWTGDVSDTEFKRLVEAIESILGSSLRHVRAERAAEKERRHKQEEERKDAVLEGIRAERGGYELVRIPGGSFTMGSPESEAGREMYEGPQREVHVPEFYMGLYPVTNYEYGRFLNENPNFIKPKYLTRRKFNQPRQPVVGVSWDDAKGYAEWAGLRLPSEAEWEYACRAGTNTRFFTGDTNRDLGLAGWYGDNSSSRTHPVGEKEPNAFGLYDMHGNVLEWVEDDWHDDYEGAPDDENAWICQPRGDNRVFRGGSWCYGALGCRSAYRDQRYPGFRFDHLGFRLARSVTLDS